jgi:hypothetical protein
MKNLKNECADKSHGCDQNSLCADKMVGYTCHCNHGYIGDGKNCETTDLDYCRTIYKVKLFLISSS